MTNIFEYNYLIYKKQSLLMRSLSQKKNMDKEFEQRKQRDKRQEKKTIKVKNNANPILFKTKNTLEY